MVVSLVWAHQYHGCTSSGMPEVDQLCCHIPSSASLLNNILTNTNFYTSKSICMATFRPITYQFDPFDLLYVGGNGVMVLGLTMTGWSHGCVFWSLSAGCSLYPTNGLMLFYLSLLYRLNPITDPHCLTKMAQITCYIASLLLI